jgi:hypothetical protein
VFDQFGEFSMHELIIFLAGAGCGIVFMCIDFLPEDDDDEVSAP